MTKGQAAFEACLSKLSSKGIILTKGQAAFEAFRRYRKTAGWVMPGWGGIGRNGREAWEIAAEAACEAHPDCPAANALDKIAKMCGAPDWEYPGQVVRDVQDALERHEGIIVTSNTTN